MVRDQGWWAHDGALPIVGGRVYAMLTILGNPYNSAKNFAVKVETDRDARWVGKVAPRGSPSLWKSCCW